jgi:hypothetical protein
VYPKDARPKDNCQLTPKPPFTLKAPVNVFVDAVLEVIKTSPVNVLFPAKD